MNLKPGEFLDDSDDSCQSGSGEEDFSDDSEKDESDDECDDESGVSDGEVSDNEDSKKADDIIDELD